VGFTGDWPIAGSKVFIVAPHDVGSGACVLDLLEMGLVQDGVRNARSLKSPRRKTGLWESGFSALPNAFKTELHSACPGVTAGLLPDPVTAMLQAGERLGDIRKVLPACRDALNAGLRARWSLQLSSVFSPLLPLLAVTLFLVIVIIPKFQEIFNDCWKTAVPSRPAVIRTPKHCGIVFLRQCWGSCYCFSAGAPTLALRLLAHIQSLFDNAFFVCHGATSECSATFPPCWHSSGMQRAEAEAVTLAAQSTGQPCFRGPFPTGDRAFCNKVRNHRGYPGC